MGDPEGKSSNLWEEVTKQAARIGSFMIFPWSRPILMYQPWPGWAQELRILFQGHRPEELLWCRKLPSNIGGGEAMENKHSCRNHLKETPRESNNSEILVLGYCQICQRRMKYYNQHRYHEAIDNVTPCDRFYGRDKEILEQRQRTKTETMSQRKRIYRLFLMNDLMGGYN